VNQEPYPERSLHRLLLWSVSVWLCLTQAEEKREDSSSSKLPLYEQPASQASAIFSYHCGHVSEL
jgi:hypothetical protein